MIGRRRPWTKKAKSKPTPTAPAKSTVVVGPPADWSVRAGELVRVRMDLYVQGRSENIPGVIVLNSSQYDRKTFVQRTLAIKKGTIGMFAGKRSFTVSLPGLTRVKSISIFIFPTALGTIFSLTHITDVEHITTD